MKTTRQVILVTGGRIGFLGLWFASTILLARILGPSKFGVFSLCVAFVKILSGPLGDSLDLAVLREAPVYLNTNRSQAFDLIRAAFWSRLLVGLVLILLVSSGASFVATIFFHSAAQQLLVILAVFGVLGDLLLRSITGYLQSSEAFTRFVLLEGVLQVGRFVAVLALFGFQALTATTALVVYCGAPYLVFILGLTLLPKEASLASAPRRRELLSIFHYSKWIALGGAIAALYERVDVLLLGHFCGLQEVGVYSAAFALATLPDFVTGCIGTVLYPKIVPLYQHGQLKAFNRQYVYWALPIAVIGAFSVLFLSGFVFRTFFTDRYLASIPAFQLLTIGSLFWGTVTPIPAALVSFVTPQRVVQISAVALCLNLLTGVMVIPIWGTLGAAALVLTMRVIMGVWLASLAQRMLRQEPGALNQAVGARQMTSPEIAPEQSTLARL